MNTYSGFGTFNATTKLATYQIALPLPGSNPNNAYIYQCINISNGGINGVVINMKKVVDSGAILPNTLLNYQTITIELDKLDAYDDGTYAATQFNYAKNFVVIAFHDANPLIYGESNLNLFTNLTTIAASAVASITTTYGTASGPTKTGFGALKKM